MAKGTLAKKARNLKTWTGLSKDIARARAAGETYSPSLQKRIKSSIAKKPSGKLVGK
jgi:hypothetical protein